MIHPNRSIVTAFGFAVPLLLGACVAGRIEGSHPFTVNDGTSPDPNDLLACNACHGTTADGAPPKDLMGNTATTAKGVGAHAQHLSDGVLRVAVQCGECHLVPSAVSSAGHIDTPTPAEVTFGDLATTGGLNPMWDTTTATCSGVYCHGASRTGGTDTTPIWTKVDGTQSACGSCHGQPPSTPPHNANTTQCVDCHDTVVDANKNIINKQLHINGVVDVTGGQNCNACHGSATNNAPPQDTLGNMATSARGVGAHQAHLKDGALHKAFVCTECHVVPASIEAPGHRDTPLPAELTFGRLSKTDGATPAWTGTTCTNNYCHGSFDGGKTTTPQWTTVNGSQAACGTCHDLSPATGRHRLSRHVNLACADCHGTGYSRTSVRVADHVNGLRNVGGAGSQIKSWNGFSCTPTCHGSASW